MSHEISFVVPDDHWQIIKAYAKAKGYLRPGNLARKAMYKEMKSYPVKRGEILGCPITGEGPGEGVTVQSRASQAKK